MTAQLVLAALADVDGPVEVVGDGELAEQVRHLLGPRVQDVQEPAAVVDTTGDPGAVTAALGRLATLGTLVLAGPEPAEPVSLDLYADLHVRGLVVMGVPHFGGPAVR